MALIQLGFLCVFLALSFFGVTLGALYRLSSKEIGLDRRAALALGWLWWLMLAGWVAFTWNAPQ